MVRWPDREGRMTIAGTTSSDYQDSIASDEPMMRLGVVGAGYVGLVTAVGLAQAGHNVVLADVDRSRVEAIAQGKTPFFEPGVGSLLQSLIAEKKLLVTWDVEKTAAASKVIFLCVGTYCKGDGHIDLTAVRKASDSIGPLLSQGDGYPVVAVKCTVVPGTTEEVVIPSLEKAARAKQGETFGVAVNPEFTSEGKALGDFMRPHRIVIGTADRRTNSVLRELYDRFTCPIVETDLKTAEMIKYAANLALATRISFINEIGNICKCFGIDVYEVAKAIGLDPRIGPHFLQAGVGFGGSCLPKDIRALVARARDVGYEPDLLSSVLRVNRRQVTKLLALAEAKLGSLRGKRIAVLGLAFKPGTDDVRESPALVGIEELLKMGVVLRAYDPAARANAQKMLGGAATLVATAEEAVKDSDVVFIFTDWAEFRDPALYRGKIVFDGRRVVEPGVTSEMSYYEGLAW